MTYTNNNRTKRARYTIVSIISMSLLSIMLGGYLLLPNFQQVGQAMEIADAEISVVPSALAVTQTAGQSIQQQPFDYEPDFSHEPDIEPLCGALSQEAEDGLLSGFFTISSDDQASDGRYVHVAQGWGQRFGGLDEEHKVSYCVTVPADGTYQILAAAHAHGATNDSLYVQVDGVPAGGYIWHVEQSANYLDQYVTDAILDEPVVLYLTAGRHTLSFFLREDDTRLDRFELVPLLAAASVSNSQSTRVTDTATGILGNVTTDAGYAWLPKLAEPRIADLQVDIVDTATNGEVYRHSTQTDEAGEYRVTDIAPGSYTVTLDVPYGHFSINPVSVNVPVESERLSVASFDLLLVDDLSASTPAESPSDSLDEVSVPDTAPTDDTNTLRIYVPVVQK